VSFSLDIVFADRCKMDYYRRAIDLTRDPRTSQWMSPLLLTAEAALCALIIWKVPCRSPHGALPVQAFIYPHAPGASTKTTKIQRSTGRHICNKSTNISEANVTIP
jgi:hypothetical protein